MAYFDSMQTLRMSDHPLGTRQFSSRVFGDMYLHTITTGSEDSAFDGVALRLSESFSGPVVGAGYAWFHEINVSAALAVAMALVWDYEREMA